MVKIQMIERTNGSKVHSVNIPKEIIEEKEWKKGDEVEVINDADGIKIRRSEL